MTDLKRAVFAEGLGTAILVATVIGSGIMAERLSNGNDAIALLGNTAATGAVLYVLITLFGPISGAQFNPAVTLFLGARGQWLPFIAVQIMGGIAGTIIAHLMFDLNALQTGVKIRTGMGQWLGEGVASFGLLLTIILGARHKPDAIPALVALWIVAGYWFTSSTSFANPAVTIARAFTDSFAGIRLIDASGFILAQMTGAGLAVLAAKWLRITVTELR
jgi:glycerol uptake facilitator-like aquaporin